MKALVLGGYGNFGRLIARALAPDLEVVIAGRDLERARAIAASIGCGAALVDASDERLAQRITACGADLVISTVGPFQGQDYHVARAAIDAGAHYIDIADARDFVCGIGALDSQARAGNLFVAAGASSVPALSGAVVDRYAPAFSELREIDIGICTSSRMPGAATVGAVLGYCGRPIRRWRDGTWFEARGWQGLRRRRFRGARFSRWLCDCDVPDLALFPSRYASVRSVRFGAGLQPGLVHLGLWGLSALVRAGVIRNLASAARPLARVARSLEPLGSARSAMFVRLSGAGPDGQALEKTWELVAEAHEGANIPCMGAVSLARKLARGALPLRGAFPCVGLIDLDEYLAELRAFRVRWAVFDA